MLYFLEVSCEETTLENECCSECFGHERIERSSFEEKPALVLSSVESAIAAGSQTKLVYLLRNFVGDLLSGPSRHYSKSGSSGAGRGMPFPAAIANQRTVRNAILKILSHLDMKDEWILAATAAAREKLQSVATDFFLVNGDLETNAADGWQWQRLLNRLEGKDAPLAIADGSTGARNMLAIEDGMLAICDKPEFWEPSVSEFAGVAVETGEVTLTSGLRLSDMCVGTSPLVCDLTVLADRSEEGSNGRRVRVAVNRIRVSAGRRLRLLGLDVQIGKNFEVLDGGSVQCEDCLIQDVRRVLVSGKGSKMLLVNCSVVGCSSHGVECVAGGSIFCEGSVLKNNSGSGLYLDGCAAARVRHSCIQANTGFGVHIEEPPASGLVEIHWVTMRNNGPDGRGPRIKFRRAGASQDKPFRECRPSLQEVDQALKKAATDLQQQEGKETEALRVVLTTLRALSPDVVGLIGSAVLVRVQALVVARPELTELCAEVLQVLQSAEAIETFLDQPLPQGETELEIPQILQHIGRAALAMSSKAAGGRAEKHLPRLMHEAGRALRALRWRQSPLSCLDMLHHGILEALSAMEGGGPAPLPRVAQCLLGSGEIRETHVIAQAHLEARRALGKGFEGKKAAKHKDRQVSALEDLLELRVDLGAVLASGVGAAVRFAASKEAEGTVPQEIRERAQKLMDRWSDRERLEAWADETVGNGDAAIQAAAGADVPAVVRHALALLDQETARIPGGGAEASPADRGVAIRCARTLAVMKLSITWASDLTASIEELKAAGWLGGPAGGVNARLMREAPPPVSGLAWLFRETLKELIQESPEARKKLMKTKAKQLAAAKAAADKQAAQAKAAAAKEAAEASAADAVEELRAPPPRRRKAESPAPASSETSFSRFLAEQRKRQRC